MLTAAEIRKLLELLADEVVVPANVRFPYTISQRRSGYNVDPDIGRLQAKLSIMLEAAARAEEARLARRA